MVNEIHPERDAEMDEWRFFASRLWKFATEPPLAGAPIFVPSDKVQAAQVLMFHFGRSFRTFQAIGLLLHQGYTQDALVLARTLLEVFFEMAFIAKHPEDAHLFLEHAINLERRFQENLTKHGPEIAAATYLRIPQLEENQQKSSGLHSAWHPKFRSVKQRAVEADVPTAYYDMLYGFSSRYVHGSGDWLRDLVKPTSGGIHVSYEKDKTEAKLVLAIVCGTFLEELFIINGCLKVDMIEELRELQKEHDRITRMCWENAKWKYETDDSKETS